MAIDSTRGACRSLRDGHPGTTLAIQEEGGSSSPGYAGWIRGYGRKGASTPRLFAVSVRPQMPGRHVPASYRTKLKYYIQGNPVATVTCGSGNLSHTEGIFVLGSSNSGDGLWRRQ